MSPILLLTLLPCFHAVWIGTSQAAPVTDPTEANAVNSMFAKWNISGEKSPRKWNLSSDICSGLDLEGGNPSLYDQDDFNPGILCDCRFENHSVCHITRLKVKKLNITGRLPMELIHLTYLNTLILQENNFIGRLPTFIGNFSQLKYLSISYNWLSGELPKELGNLTKLISLGIGINNFTGKLPEELAKLSNLEQMYLNSIGVVGGLPSSFAKFKKLRIMTMGDNNFGEKLPGFIGNISSLERLRIMGNSFKGPIPSNFRNLVNLRLLWLSDMPDGNSTLSFIENMTLLSALILRNDQLSGDIPSSISKLVNLTHLDLSFNNLRGEIPQSLFNLPSLKKLYLGNNNFTGALPLHIGNQLDDIDLSYNYLSGSLPSWTNEDHLQLNLVANKFGSNRDLRWGLECIQRSTPCFLGSPVYSSFAINCGGNEVLSRDGTTTYEADDSEKLAGASYFVNKNKRWAVSSVGSIFDSPNPPYILSNSFEFPEASDQELFRSARTSPSSLRYYGLALEDGSYTVELKFSAIDLFGMQRWSSWAKRIFDIHIQGTLSNGTSVAIKQLSASSLHGREQFASEVSAISAVQHRSLVKFHGCCYEGENRLLLYGYMENKSLDHALFGKSGLHLEWPARFDICLGTARGLAYLHEEASIRIIHRDIKASNILLGANLNAKISDFGLAKLYDDAVTHIVTRVAGTLGYLAPEYAMRGFLTEKVDVYGFGILLLEILTGRPIAKGNSDGRKFDLLNWSWNLYEKNQGLEMLDPSLSSFNEMEATRTIKIAFLCIQTNPLLRPTMSHVLAMLLGDAEIGTVSSKPAYLNEWDSEDTGTWSDIPTSIST